MKAQRFSNEAFTLIELMVVVLSISLLAGTAFAAYGNYVKRSKTVEAVTILNQLASLQYQYYNQHNEFIETGPTNIPPGPNAVNVDFLADPSHNWALLRFSVNDPIRYGYRCYENGSPQAWACQAVGDLDGDGIPSLHFIEMFIDASGNFVRGSVYGFDELE